MHLYFIHFIHFLLPLGNLAYAATTTSPPSALKSSLPPGQYSVWAVARPEIIINSFWWQVCYRNSSAFIGDIKYDRLSEPLILNLGPGPGETGLSFTSFHTVPTGWQNMYIFPKASGPVSFTSPHSGFVPSGGSPYSFTVRRGLDPQSRDAYLIR